jgi:hypothetical protein
MTNFKHTTQAVSDLGDHFEDYGDVTLDFEGGPFGRIKFGRGGHNDTIDVFVSGGGDPKVRLFVNLVWPYGFNAEQSHRLLALLTEAVAAQASLTVALNHDIAMAAVPR